MTDSNTQTKTVGDDMAARRIFANPEEAANYLNQCGESFSDFANIPLAAPGIDEEGNFDSAVYVDGMVPMVATLKNQKTGVKAIVVAPIPTLDFLLSDDAGRQWVEKIIQKELNHVAVRPLRDAEDISTVVDQMPTTRDAYISSAREGGSGILETFNELYKLINSTLAGKVPVWSKARLIKGELKKAMESAGYAAEYYPALENRGEGKDSLFVVALNLGINAAKKKGMDPTIFERWLATRDAKKFSAQDQDDADDFDVDSLTDSLMEAKEDEAPAGEEQPAAE
jgi:hypothetical protein